MPLEKLLGPPIIYCFPYGKGEDTIFQVLGYQFAGNLSVCLFDDYLSSLINFKIHKGKSWIGFATVLFPATKSNAWCVVASWSSVC